MYRTIDINSWHRRDLFRFFQKYDDPTWDVMGEVSITPFYERIKKEQASFFLSFLYIATHALNSIQEMRLRIDGSGNVIEFATIHPGSTILYENGTFGFGYFRYQPDFSAFLKEAEAEFEIQKTKKDLDPKDEDLARIYFSPIPWISFSGFRHPFYKGANHSIPKIVFGKHFERGNERILSVGITLHHGLADGYHAGLFFQRLQEELNQPESFLPPAP